MYIARQAVGDSNSSDLALRVDKIETAIKPVIDDTSDTPVGGNPEFWK